MKITKIFYYENLALYGKAAHKKKGNILSSISTLRDLITITWQYLVIEPFLMPLCLS